MYNILETFEIIKDSGKALCETVCTFFVRSPLRISLLLLRTVLHQYMYQLLFPLQTLYKGNLKIKQNIEIDNTNINNRR